MLALKQLLQAVSANPTNILAASLYSIFSIALPSMLYAQALTVERFEQRQPVWIDGFEPELILEDDYSAYDQRLVDPLYYHAVQLQEQDQHAEALSLFKEAIHILRINRGLYDESQIDLLDFMIESEIALQDWEAVDKHYAYMEYLYRRLYPVHDPRLELGLQKVVSWHVNALNVNIDGKRIEHLQQANKLFKLRLQVAELTLTADDPKLEFLNQNIAICEKQLYLASELNKEMQRRQQRVRQNSLIADRE